jgi:hypothetical protein
VKPYSPGVILALIFLAFCTTIAYLMGLKDGMRGLEALEAQHQNAILERTHDRDVQLEIEKPSVKNGLMICASMRGKDSYPPGTPYATLQRSVRNKNV